MAKRWICSVCGTIEKGSSPPQQCPSCGAPFTAFELRERNPLAKFKNIEIVDARAKGFRYVIVGNSAAARSAARAIGALDPGGSVTIIAEEDAKLYARPMLPDLIGGAEPDALFGVGEAYPVDAFELLVDPATAIDPTGKSVTCASGAEVGYDALLLATGSGPRQIPWPGSEAAGIHYFRTYADALAISKATESSEHAVVVGGGLLGLEFVRAFHARGVSTTLLIRGDVVGFPGLDRDTGEIVRLALEDWGVEVALDEEVESFESADGAVTGVVTTKGRTIECDVVGVAVGAVARTDLAEAAGLEMERGILVDEHFATSAPGIYAAGDVAQVHDFVWGDSRVVTSWRNAQAQGEMAGIYMAGGAGSFPGTMATNYQLAAGLPFCAIGISNPPNPEDFEFETQSDEAARTCRKLVTRDGKLVGAALVGDLSEAAEIEEQVREQSVATPTEPTAVRTAKSEAEPEPVEEPQREKEMSGMRKMTEENLQAAFAGESQAHMKYLNFAKKAAKEGKENVARLFRATSFAEQAHASHHLDVLGGIGSTSENLGVAMEGENHEVEEMYPAFMAVADAQDEDDAYEAFDYALKAEVQHHDLYVRAQKAVEAGGDAQLEAIQVCSFCGQTIEGEAPEKCPVCRSPKKNFVKF